ncbi:helix-turn-helix domain-containing protein [Streptomyces sp. BE20]|uniref:GlxA family transcriptional regulator n=1 Tax=Streptomyces sp. BE20 TaxID=3002525 RepID=UPI002E7A464C|nr:helix-turn-helix domain-containing protein [Streptomyces sp. BE20]MEE1822620.1 helix-turn-helix domain-containing protein [Streptomyces sp. BE20]
MPVIAVLVPDRLPGHHLTTPGLVFGTAARDHPGVAYDVRLCAAGGGPGPGRIGLPAPTAITLPWGLAGAADADVVLLPSREALPVHQGLPATESAEVLHAAAARGARIAAVGTGVFDLAATGLLDGRRATTGWRHQEELARRHPRVEVDPAGTLVGDGPFLTSAGIFGGLDVCLRVLAQDHGEQVAGDTCRELLSPLVVHAERVREGIDRGLADSSGLDDTLAWLDSRIHLPLTPADIAAHAGISVSSLNRRFRARTGLSAQRYLLRLRLQRARELLEGTDDPVESVAARAGFTSPAGLRHHFGQLTGTTPRAYRARHRTTAPGP